MVPLFADFEPEKYKWITPFDKKIYPDHFEEAIEHYKPYIEEFRRLANSVTDSAELLRAIQRKTNPMQTQLLRIFNRYVCPTTSVEMLKVKSSTKNVIEAFGPLFRDIFAVQKNINHEENDMTLACLLHEHKDRGQLGYRLTGEFFDWFEERFPEFEAKGPRGAGKDIALKKHLNGYPHECPTDIIILYKGAPVVAGFARYDSDRGGAQEDDRTGGNRSKILEITEYENEQGRPLKIFFLNDGPGLLLGSMWRDYAGLEQINPARILVATLKMLPLRLTQEWMLADQ